MPQNALTAAAFRYFAPNIAGIRRESRLRANEIGCQARLMAGQEAAGYQGILAPAQLATPPDFLRFPPQGRLIVAGAHASAALHGAVAELHFILTGQEGELFHVARGNRRRFDGRNRSCPHAVARRHAHPADDRHAASGFQFRRR
ncbi:hypothetical protein BQ8794_220186 [Mesorhizobium prunaredense]|uniref:Uncharacterized protein n=1 Tax=Mesorhizobium prunaredense TaxID=1631249 RepID=A0A1R3V6X4_9HYPH|nr:hypothetical protein BQ8794_220186 [Mesorhizobium prunaredense]